MLMRLPTICFPHSVTKRQNRRGGHSHIGSIRDVRLEWVGFQGQKPADGCKCLTKNLRMGHKFDIILPGNGWFSFILIKT